MFTKSVTKLFLENGNFRIFPILSQKRGIVWVDREHCCFNLCSLWAELEAREVHFLCSLANNRSGRDYSDLKIFCSNVSKFPRLALVRRPDSVQKACHSYFNNHRLLQMGTGRELWKHGILFTVSRSSPREINYSMIWCFFNCLPISSPFLPFSIIKHFFWNQLVLFFSSLLKFPLMEHFRINKNSYFRTIHFRQTFYSTEQIILPTFFVISVDVIA